jgi:integrase
MTDTQRSRPLLKFFGDMRIKRISAEMIEKYQQERSKTGVSGRTINLEVGLLRRVLKNAKQWACLADAVEMLPERPKEARVLSPEEKEILIRTGTLKSEWQVPRCVAVLALNTTMRGCELRGLRLKDIDLFSQILTIKRQSTKTDGGARVIPLNRDAVLALSELLKRAKNIGCNNPEHYLFPACESGHVDPNKPTKGWRTAWRSMTRAAGLKGLRFHDLRHQAITELAEIGLSDQTIMSIAGHVNKEMLDHYSHIRMEAKRKALEALETQIPTPELPADELATTTVN